MPALRPARRTLINTIRKYEIIPEGHTRVVCIKMPESAKVLHVAAQGSSMFLWAMVDTNRPMQERKFEVYSTGHAMLVGRPTRLKHLGTTMLAGGSLVFHVFERVMND